MHMQVLNLESKVAEYEQQQAAFQTQLQQSKLEAQRAQRALRTAQHDAAGSSDGAGLRALPGLALRMQDQGASGMLDTDSWAEPASVGVSWPLPPSLPPPPPPPHLSLPLSCFVFVKQAASLLLKPLYKLKDQTKHKLRGSKPTLKVQEVPYMSLKIPVQS